MQAFTFTFKYCISAQTLLTQNKNISTTPITLEITSPDVPDLTLIDLPGITEVAFGGQDEDIVDQVGEETIQLI